MTNANAITQEQYEDEKSERLAASELDRTERYDARIKTDVPELGVYALVDYVQVIDIIRDGEDFELTLASVESGATRTSRISLNGIVYAPGMNPTEGEQGYFRTPPLGDLDHELEELLSMLEPAPILRQQTEPRKRLEIPLPVEPHTDPSY